MNSNLFQCGGCAVDPPALLVAAAYWGEILPLCEDARRAHALDTAASQLPNVAPSTLQARSETFRRARGLRSAKETERWLAARCVDLEQFTAHLQRESLSKSLHQPLSAMAEAAVDALLWPTAVFSGRVDTWCLRLAEHMAALHEIGDGAAEVTQDSNPVEDTNAAAAWACRLGADSAWPETLHAAERAYTAFSAQTLTAARLESALRNQWRDLVLVDYEAGVFPSEMAAREALLCVRDDGVVLAEVCRNSNASYEAAIALARDLPGEARAQALGAEPGAVLTPFRIEGGFALYCVRAKHIPALDLPPVHDAVAASVLGESLRPLVARHVAWHTADATA